MMRALAFAAAAAFGLAISTLTYLSGFYDGADAALCVTGHYLEPERPLLDNPACRRADRSLKARALRFSKEIGR